MARLTISPSPQTFFPQTFFPQTFFPQTFLTKAYETAILTTTAGNFVTKAFFKEHVQFMRKALEEARKAGKRDVADAAAAWVKRVKNGRQATLRDLDAVRSEMIRHIRICRNRVQS